MSTHRVDDVTGRGVQSAHGVSLLLATTASARLVARDSQLVAHAQCCIVRRRLAY